MNCQEFKSPPYKLIKFFKDSRDSWEAAAKKRRNQIRDLKASIRDLRTSRDLWKGKAKAAVKRRETQEQAFQSVHKALVELQAAHTSLQQEHEELKKKHKAL